MHGEGAPLQRAGRLALSAFWFSIFSVPAGAQTMTEEFWSAGSLHGTFMQPANRAPPGPAVLIIAGSGPTDRNGNGPGLSTDTYKLLAEGFAAHGIRSLRYDKRGIGESRAMVAREEEARFTHFVDDAIAAIKALSARADVSKVIVAGHSEGALIAILAAQKNDLAGVILLAATGRPLAAVLRDQLRAGLPEPLRTDALNILDRLSAGERVEQIRPELNSLFRPSVQPFLMSLISIDPAEELKSLKTPVLLVQAGRDLQIQRSDFDALTKARPDIRTIMLPQANHTLKVAPEDRAGNIALYTNRRAPLDPGLMPPLIDFVQRVAR
jgi:alpha-beta hydrolase superfamily lysophospholipase